MNGTCGQEHGKVCESLGGLWHRYEEQQKTNEKMERAIEDRRVAIDQINQKITYGVFMLALSLLASLGTLLAELIRVLI